ncbi:hypothetical protein [Kordiimonas sp.]|uniref:hypothetical protein n=1 Tax=Kordiimonas sp. TaxID=1970157 RepID=UPI003A930874
MTYDADKSIDLSYRFLLGLWLAGALCLAAALLMDEEKVQDPCTVMQMHFDFYCKG